MSTKQYREEHRKEAAEYQRKYYKDNPEKIREMQRRHHKTRLQYIQNYKLSKSCQVCGYNKCASALVFHHNGDKEFGIGGNYSMSLKRTDKEMDKCVVLCRNCHAELHEKEKTNNQ